MQQETTEGKDENPWGLYLVFWLYLLGMLALAPKLLLKEKKIYYPKMISVEGTVDALVDSAADIGNNFLSDADGVNGDDQSPLSTNPFGKTATIPENPLTNPTIPENPLDNPLGAVDADPKDASKIILATLEITMDSRRKTSIETIAMFIIFLIVFFMFFLILLTTKLTKFFETKS
jgi:hypothetical protein